MCTHVLLDVCVCMYILDPYTDLYVIDVENEHVCLYVYMSVRMYVRACMY